ncbi:rRNA maturation RNase YbeY [Candidatus Parcubacteria bacterium]|nr:rRNA maturation RNase YbeY [Candidatus Parcubacteria bacterium]
MIEINNKTKAKIDIKLIKKITEDFFSYYKIKNKELSIAFIGDAVMSRLNKQYRGKDKPTDILSFRGEGDELGEIIIDYAQIKRQAKKYSKSVKEELIFILVHGLLHLIGYEDETENGKRKMKKLGKEFIFHTSSEYKQFKN